MKPPPTENSHAAISEMVTIQVYPHCFAEGVDSFVFATLLMERRKSPKTVSSASQLG